MGFFSSRKVEPSPLPASERASLKVIRSRFYGKSKSLGRASPAPSASPPAAVPRTLPNSPARIPEEDSTNQSPTSPGRSLSSNAHTMSLAQRLNDLATANADGLLDDNEYRLLRQNLFERFTTDSDSPNEPPVVPPSNDRYPSQHHTRPPSLNSQRSISTAVSSLFRRASGRAAPSPAISTSASVFASQQQMKPIPDSASITTSYSRPSMSTPRSPISSRPITRRPSDESLMSTSQAGSTSASLTTDMRGVMSRRNIIGGNPAYAASISSRITGRSAKPPSAFHLRHPTLHRQTFPRTHEDDDDEDNPKSSAELREEIETVESEGRKLLDAFNGLELSALTSGSPGGPLSAATDSNQRRLSVYPDSTTSSTLGSAYTLVPERSASMRVRPQVPLVNQPVSLKRKPSVVNSITDSFKSTTSDLRGNGRLPLQSARSSPNLHVSATVPALPVSHTVSFSPLTKRLSGARQVPTSPSNGVQSNGPPPPHTALNAHTTPLAHRTNTDPTLHALEIELADIRRRKADVSARYERRLEFLRAKLKAAEIRERLAKK